MTLQNQLHSIANENGGGLSTSVSGKYTSVRHELARLDGKATAGEAGKIISKALKIKVSAQEVVEAYKLTRGYEPEWHHAGFYRGSNGRKTMGRTFFFNEYDIEQLILDWATIDEKKAEIARKAQEAKKIAEAKSKFEKKYGTPFNRLSRGSLPRFNVILEEEMNGKYGWFQADSRYNLPIYYSGFSFKSKKTLEKYYSLFF